MSVQQYPDDEIDLRDHIKVMIKRKKTILTVFLICVITTTVISFLMPKVYEITGTIQLGSINDKLLISKEEAQEIILNQDSLLSVMKELNLANIDVEHLKKDIKIKDIKNTNLLKVKIQYPELDIALKINEKIIVPFISQGQSIYQKRISIIESRLKELNAQIEKVREDIEKTQDLIVNLPNTAGISAAEESLRTILLQNSLPTYESYLTSLKNQRKDLQIMLLSDAKEFKIFELTIPPKYPVKPNKRLNITISAILGLMLGVFIAFFQEFWQKSKF